MPDDIKLHQRSGVMKATIAAFINWINTAYTAYGTTMNTYLVRNIADLRQPGRLKNQSASDEGPVFSKENKDTVEFPLLRIALGDVSVDETKAGLKPRGPLMIERSPHRDGSATFDSAIPIRMTMAVKFDSDNMDHVIDFVSMIFHALPKVSFSIAHEGGFVFETSAQLESSLTIPQADMSAPGDPYSLETVVILNTYIGLITQGRVIREIKLRVGQQPTRSIPIEIQTIPILGTSSIKFYELFDSKSMNNKFNF